MKSRFPTRKIDSLPRAASDRKAATPTRLLNTISHASWSVIGSVSSGDLVIALPCWGWPGRSPRSPFVEMIEGE